MIDYIKIEQVNRGITELVNDLNAAGDISDMLRTSDLVTDGAVDKATIQNILQLTAGVMWHLATELESWKFELNEFIRGLSTGGKRNE